MTWVYINHHGVYGVNESNPCFYIHLELLRSTHVWSEWQYPSTPIWYVMVEYHILLNIFPTTLPVLILSMHDTEQTSLRSTIHIQNEHNKHPTLETQ